MKHLRAWREPTARTLLCVAALVAAGSLARPAEAQSSPGRVAAGHRLAETFCAQCHVIIRGGPAGWTDAPSFPAVADRPDITSAWLQRFIQKPHVDMLSLPRNQSAAADLAAYILSLRQR